MNTSLLVEKTKVILEFLAHCGLSLMCTYGVARLCHILLK